MDINRVFFTGRLTKDPESREVKPGLTLCKIIVATDASYKKEGAEPVKETAFVECTTWNKVAESCSSNLKKGSSVAIEGRLKMEKWIDKDTAKERSRLAIATDTVIFLDPKKMEQGQTMPGQTISGKAPTLNEALTQQWDESLPF